MPVTAEPGYLQQGRFGANVIEEEHLAHAMRYVLLNPLVKRAADWPWSSIRAHLAGRDDELVRVAPAVKRYGRFADFFGSPADYAGLAHPASIRDQRPAARRCRVDHLARGQRRPHARATQAWAQGPSCGDLVNWHRSPHGILTW